MGVQLKFYDSENEGSICLWVNQMNEITLHSVSDVTEDVITISLDIPTAIKLHKTLRQEIAKIKEGGQDNG
jgi:hypothetical protein